MNIIVSISRFTILFMMVIYTYDCFAALSSKISEKKSNRLYHKQTVLMILILLNANLVMFLVQKDIRLLGFCLMELIYFTMVFSIFKYIYHHLSYSLINNMCMLLCVGLLTLTRLDFDKAFRQFIMAAIALAVSCLIPLMIDRMKVWNRLKWIYALIGILGLGLVTFFGNTHDGAKLNITFGAVSIQPSEFIKIIFVFLMASILYEMPHDDVKNFWFHIHTEDFKRVLIASLFAAGHLIMLVLAKDLGTACIYFVTYLTLIFVSSRKPIYLFLGAFAFAGAFVLGSKIFTHVQTRIIAWKDPLSVANDAGYQICQSLFAIGAGGWFGSGIYQGTPNKIPIVTSDFIFSAIAEEYGGIFCICLILICMSCFLMIFNVALQIKDIFYKLVALGLGTVYAIQVFMTLGGVTKLIPSTGITLPFISYGGSSLISTFILFAIVQGLYAKTFVGEDPEEDEEYEEYE